MTEALLCILPITWFESKGGLFSLEKAIRELEMNNPWLHK